MSTPERFLERAIALSQLAIERNAGGPFGAVIVHEGRVIAEGHNEVLASGDPTAHAEVVAIRAASRSLATHELSSCELYTSCEPCPMCLGAIYWARLSRVYYANTRHEAAAIGFDDAHLYVEFGRSIEARTIPFIRIALPTAGAPMQAWHEKPDKRQY